MSWMNRLAQRNTSQQADAAMEPELAETLADFKVSVHAWSEAAYHRPRTMHRAVVRRTWRLAAGWAMACVLVAGAGSAAVYERHQRAEQARIAAAARAAEQQRELAAQHARAEEDLMTKVDSDVSREVPDAMEPLAALMSDDSTQ